MNLFRENLSVISVDLVSEWEIEISKPPPREVTHDGNSVTETNTICGCILQSTTRGEGGGDHFPKFQQVTNNNIDYNNS